MYYIWCVYIKEILTSPEVKGKKKRNGNSRPGIYGIQKVVIIIRHSQAIWAVTGLLTDISNGNIGTILQENIHLDYITAYIHFI